MSVPLSRPVGAAFRITQPYGPSQVTAEPPRMVDGVLIPHFHSGIDYGNGRCGDPVLAAADGLVTISLTQTADRNNNLIKIVHDEGISTAYAHLAMRLVFKGDHVTRGEVIGTIGDTGRAQGCHLHFIAALNNKDFDPETLMGGDVAQASITEESAALATPTIGTPILDLDGVTVLTATGGVWIAASPDRFSPYGVGELRAFIISYPLAGQRRTVLMAATDVKQLSSTPRGSRAARLPRNTDGADTEDQLGQTPSG